MLLARCRRADSGTAGLPHGSALPSDFSNHRTFGSVLFRHNVVSKHEPRIPPRDPAARIFHRPGLSESGSGMTTPAALCVAAKCLPDGHSRRRSRSSYASVVEAGHLPAQACAGRPAAGCVSAHGPRPLAEGRHSTGRGGLWYRVWIGGCTRLAAARWGDGSRVSSEVSERWSWIRRADRGRRARAPDAESDASRISQDARPGEWRNGRRWGLKIPWGNTP